jgi:NAD(P)H-quinone oxidoreductase subunit 5
VGIKDFFYIDNLSLLMMGLIGFVGICILSFSRRYLQGDSQQKMFFMNLTILLISLSIMVCADNLILFLGFWFLSNYFLTRLMLHKKEWPAARASARLALRNFILGTFFIGIGFTLLYRFKSF